MLPDNTNVMRADKAFGNAVRAKVLMQMKRYDEAARYAAAALRYNNNLENRSATMTTGSWELPWDNGNNYLYAGGGARVSLTYTCMSKELAALFSPDDFIRKYETGWNSLPTWEDAAVEYAYPGGMIYTAFSNVIFNNYGIRTEDMYYLLAETSIRGGQIDDGLNYVDMVQMRRIDGYTALKGSGLSQTQAMKRCRKPRKWRCMAPTTTSSTASVGTPSPTIAPPSRATSATRAPTPSRPTPPVGNPLPGQRHTL